LHPVRGIWYNCSYLLSAHEISTIRRAKFGQLSAALPQTSIIRKQSGIFYVAWLKNIYIQFTILMFTYLGEMKKSLHTNFLYY